MLPDINEKPHVNRFAFQSYLFKNHSSAMLLPVDSYHYREELEPFLGAVVKIYATKWKCFFDRVNTRNICKICILDGWIVAAPTGRNLPLPVRVTKLWTAVDRGFFDRNPNLDNEILLKGYLYAYSHIETRGTNFQTYWIKPPEPHLSKILSKGDICLTCD